MIELSKAGKSKFFVSLAVGVLIFAVIAVVFFVFMGTPPGCTGKRPAE